VLGSLLSEAGSVVIDGERAERDVEVEIDFLSFLNGRASAFTLFCTFVFKDAALPERDDLAEEAAVDFGIEGNLNSPLLQNNLYFPRSDRRSRNE
jgi:hypothetical protein